LLLIWVTILAGALVPARVDAQKFSDAQLRVNFLLNFMRFTTWPPAPPGSADKALELCVLSLGDPFEGALASIDGEQAAGHRISVRNQIRAAQAGTCSLLYVPDASLPRLADARDAIGSRPVLIVGESETILDRGGMIGLRGLDRRLSFVVNLGVARRAGLNFAPQMLHAAAEVLP
jgi:hypothetical protein